MATWLITTTEADGHDVRRVETRVEADGHTNEEGLITFHRADRGPVLTIPAARLVYAKRLD